MFAGTTRIATKLEMPPKSQPPSQQPPGDGTGTREKFFYFYHPDHLGSTSYVTDQSGEVYQHLEYFPFGETWVDESPGNSTDRVPYRFTGKELDEETQLYYFGARYYDPRTSLWTAADPALEDYLTDTKPAFVPTTQGMDWKAELAGPGMGGIFAPKNINVYSYAHQNPLKLTDPDGNLVFLPVIFYAASAAITAYEVYQVGQAVYSGEKTLGEAVTDEAPGIIVGAATGVAGKGISWTIKAYRAYQARRIERLREQAIKARDELAASLKEKGEFPSTVTGAYNKRTGKVTAKQSAAPSAKLRSPEHNEAADRAGGLGNKGKKCDNTVGACSETHAADDVLGKDSKLDDLGLTPAVRPRTDQVIPRCENCKEMYGPE